jgi:hypothetical protein
MGLAPGLTGRGQRLMLDPAIVLMLVVGGRLMLLLIGPRVDGKPG